MVRVVETRAETAAMFRSAVPRLPADAPLRMPREDRTMAGAHLEAQRQLRISLWMVAILSVATAMIAVSSPAVTQVTALPPATVIR